MCCIFLVNSNNLESSNKNNLHYIIDLDKLSFGSLILGSVLRGGFGFFQIFISGIVPAIVLLIIGKFLLSKDKE
jgi:hypothetical protein